jgi:hypothetical protein
MVFVESLAVETEAIWLDAVTIAQMPPSAATCRPQKKRRVAGGV